jgi:hypothetical protein
MPCEDSGFDGKPKGGDEKGGTESEREEEQPHIPADGDGQAEEHSALERRK